MPKTGGLDSKGKKLKALPAPELKAVLERISTGVHDGQMPDSGEFWPSASQAAKIKKAIEDRNSQLKQEREDEKVHVDDVSQCCIFVFIFSFDLFPSSTPLLSLFSTL